MKRRPSAVYAGSFDPPTLGHLDLVKRAASIFGELHVLIAQNNAKTYLLPLEERISLMEELCFKFKNVKVAATSLLVTSYMSAEKIDILVRGIRTLADYNFELQMAEWNRTLLPKTETLFLAASPQLAHISSTGVKELITFGGDFSRFVPPLVHDVLTKKIRSGMIIQLPSEASPQRGEGYSLQSGADGQEKKDQSLRSGADGQGKKDQSLQSGADGQGKKGNIVPSVETELDGKPNKKDTSARDGKVVSGRKNAGRKPKSAPSVNIAAAAAPPKKRRGRPPKKTQAENV